MSDFITKCQKGKKKLKLTDYYVYIHNKPVERY